MVNLLIQIPQEARDRFLYRYLFKCRVLHALAFFQWRCLSLDDPEAIDKNKAIFYQRIDHLAKNLQD